jgi:hypothetical protein
VEHPPGVPRPKARRLAAPSWTWKISRCNVWDLCSSWAAHVWLTDPYCT